MSESEHCLFWFCYLYSRLHLKHKDTAFSCHFQYIYFYMFSFKREMSKPCFFLPFSKCDAPILYVSCLVFYPLYILHQTLHVLHLFSFYPLLCYCLLCPYFESSLLMLRHYLHSGSWPLIKLRHELTLLFFKRNNYPEQGHKTEHRITYQKVCMQAHFLLVLLPSLTQGSSSYPKVDKISGLKWKKGECLGRGIFAEP